MKKLIILFAVLLFSCEKKEVIKKDCKTSFFTLSNGNPNIPSSVSLSALSGYKNYYRNGVLIGSGNAIKNVITKSGHYTFSAENSDCPESKYEKTFVAIEPISNDYSHFEYEGMDFYAHRDAYLKTNFQSGAGYLVKEVSEIKRFLKPNIFKKLNEIPSFLEETGSNGATMYGWWQGSTQKGAIRKDVQLEFFGMDYIVKQKETKRTGPDLLFFHEMCHGLHYKHLPNGFNNKYIRDTYLAAMKKGLYSGAYSAKNEFEYFATLAEKYYGYDYTYPHDKFELKSYDLDGFKMIEEIFEINK
jgi:hypothetical protein